MHGGNIAHRTSCRIEAISTPAFMVHRHLARNVNNPPTNTEMNWKMCRRIASGLGGKESGMEFAAGIYFILKASRYVMVSKAMEHKLPPN